MAGRGGRLEAAGAGGPPVQGFPILTPKSASAFSTRMGPAGFEPASSSFGGWRSCSAELRTQIKHAEGGSRTRSALGPASETGAYTSSAAPAHFDGPG